MFRPNLARINNACLGALPMNRQPWLLLVGLLVFLTSVAATALAAPRPVEPTQQWSGSVGDEALMPQKLLTITTAEAWKSLWQQWEPAVAVPEVDFTKQFVVVAATRGSILRLSATLDEPKVPGDLRVTALASRDLRPGFRHVMAAFDRAGIKSVNGQPLAEPSSP
jgi:hypothetical protein